MLPGPARRWLTVASLAGVAAACSSITFEPSGYYVRLQEQLDRERALWAAQDLTSYRYQFSRTCFCEPDLLRPALVDVTGSAIASVTYTDSNTAVPESAHPAYFTVEGLFDQIQIAINLGADSITARYDLTLHYPTTIRVDLNAFLPDDELELFATELTAKP